MKRILATTAVIGLAVAGVGTASAQPAVYKVTGGGQITSSNDMTGPGNTLAFNAQSAVEEGEPAKGQVQYIDRSGGRGQDQVKYHGTVTCVVTMQGDETSPATARIEGVMRDDAAQSFTIDVIDNGQGSQSENDMISFRLGGNSDEDGDGDTTCDLNDEFLADGGLGRGNVKIHKVQ